MTNLLEDVTAAFNAAGGDQEKNATGISVTGGMHLITDDDDLMVGFLAMRDAYEKYLLHALRKAYHHFAGSTLPENHDELISKTGPVVGPDMTRLAIRAFADGVMIGQQDDPLVRMAVFYNKVNDLFTDDDYNEAVELLANGFANDIEVKEHFDGYIRSAVHGISHATGFAHSSGKPAKVWDVWALSGAATEAASYMAGLRMGETWRLRDELDGIVIATEEGSDDSS